MSIAMPNLLPDAVSRFPASCLFDAVCLNSQAFHGMARNAATEATSSREPEQQQGHLPTGSSSAFAGQKLNEKCQ
jgi:hypothetical protein